MQHAAAPALSRAPQNKRQLKTESNYKLKKNTALLLTKNYQD